MGDSKDKMSKLSTKSAKSVDDAKRTNSNSCPYKPRIEEKSSKNQKGAGVPPLPKSPQKQSIPVSNVKKPPPPPPEPSSIPSQNIEISRKNSPTSEDTDEKTS